MSGIYDYIVQSFPYTFTSKIDNKVNNDAMLNSNDILLTDKSIEINEISNISKSNTFQKSVADTISYMIEDTSSILVDLVA